MAISHVGCNFGDCFALRLAMTNRSVLDDVLVLHPTSTNYKLEIRSIRNCTSNKTLINLFYPIIIQSIFYYLISNL